MMTLNEVIIGIEEQMGLGDPILIGALRYLREYRDYLGVLRIKEKQLEQDIASYQKAIENCEQTKNKYEHLVQNLDEVIELLKQSQADD